MHTSSFLNSNSRTIQFQVFIPLSSSVLADQPVNRTSDDARPITNIKSEITVVFFFLCCVAAWLVTIVHAHTDNTHRTNDNMLRMCFMLLLIRAQSQRLAYVSRVAILWTCACRCLFLLLSYYCFLTLSLSLWFFVFFFFLLFLSHATQLARSEMLEFGSCLCIYLYI